MNGSNIINLNEYRTKKWDRWIPLDDVISVRIGEHDGRFVIQIIYENKTDFCVSLDAEKERNDLYHEIINYIRDTHGGARAFLIAINSSDIQKREPDKENPMTGETHGLNPPLGRD